MNFMNKTSKINIISYFITSFCLLLHYTKFLFDKVTLEHALATDSSENKRKRLSTKSGAGGSLSRSRPSHFVFGGPLGTPSDQLGAFHCSLQRI